MLQHSRASTGQKEPTDINALADEYLRLSLSWSEGKRQIIQCNDQKQILIISIGKINIVPQDIGRVF